MVQPSTKEIKVRGMVTLIHGIRILVKEDTRIPAKRSVIMGSFFVWLLFYIAVYSASESEASASELLESVVVESSESVVSESALLESVAASSGCVKSVSK